MCLYKNGSKPERDQNRVRKSCQLLQWNNINNNNSSTDIHNDSWRVCQQQRHQGQEKGVHGSPEKTDTPQTGCLSVSWDVKATFFSTERFVLRISNTLLPDAFLHSNLNEKMKIRKLKIIHLVNLRAHNLDITSNQNDDLLFIQILLLK